MADARGIWWEGKERKWALFYAHNHLAQALTSSYYCCKLTQEKERHKLSSLLHHEYGGGHQTEDFERLLVVVGVEHLSGKAGHEPHGP